MTIKGVSMEMSSEEENKLCRPHSVEEEVDDDENYREAWYEINKILLTNK
jgi:hypothetical protein